MFEIFIALFGGVYFLGKYASDKIGLNPTRVATNAYNKNLEAWRARVTDRALEMNIRKLLADVKNSPMVWDEVKDAYDELGWDIESRDEFRCYFPMHPWLMQIMLAKRGKIESYNVTLGIKKENKNNQNTADLVRWIQKQLNRHGIYDEVYLDIGPFYGNGYQNMVFPLDVSDDYGGTYRWAPTLHPSTIIRYEKL